MLLSFRTRVDKFGYGHQLCPQGLEAALGVGLVTHQGLVKPREAAQPRANGVHLTSPGGDLGLGPGLALIKRGLLQVALCKKKKVLTFPKKTNPRKVEGARSICDGSCRGEMQ